MNIEPFSYSITLLALSSPFLILISLSIPLLKDSKALFRIFVWAILLGCVVLAVLLHLFFFALTISNFGDFGF
jgi:hypothetical protein